MMRQRVLDLDLDFFLDDVAYFCGASQRLSEDDFHPWAMEEVSHFLEARCRLSRATPIPGRVVTHHDEAFFWWRELIGAGVLRPPFDVVHVDAHADLGTGDTGYVYLMGELLHLPVAERSHPRRGTGGLTAGNYLGFAIACRWIGHLTYVPNPKSRDDLFSFHFKDNDPGTGTLQLKKCPSDFTRDFVRVSYGSFPVLEYEPEVPFKVIPADEFVADQPFDLGLLCLSPGFTPASADVLIPLIRAYLDEK